MVSGTTSGLTALGIDRQLFAPGLGTRLIQKGRQISRKRLIFGPAGRVAPKNLIRVIIPNRDQGFAVEVAQIIGDNQSWCLTTVRGPGLQREIENTGRCMCQDLAVAVWQHPQTGKMKLKSIQHRLYTENSQKAKAIRIRTQA